MGKSKDDDEDGAVSRRPKSSRPSSKDKDTGSTPKKSKSSTNLTSVFAKSARGKSPRKLAHERTTSGDKENTTPPGSSSAAHPTPIWAQFASVSPQEVNTTTKVPLNDRKKAIAQEMKLYLPKEYSPSKQRNFFGMQQPTLEGKRERPTSAVISLDTTAATVFDTFSKMTSNAKSSSRPKSVVETTRKSSDELVKKAMLVDPKLNQATTKKGSRVMAAVAVFNSKAKERDVEPKMDAKQIDVAFEAVLVSTWKHN
jgi:hypothetical protein